MLHIDVNTNNTEHLKPTLHLHIYSKQKFLFFQSHIFSILSKLGQ